MVEYDVKSLDIYNKFRLGHDFNPEMMIQVAEEDGIDINYDWFELILSEVGKYSDIIPTPRILSQFICRYLSRVKVENILDPWSNVGCLLDSVATCCNAQYSVGISLNSEYINAAKKLSKLKSVDWQVGDPLIILPKLDQTFNIVVSCPPIGTKRIKTKIKSESGKIEIYDEAGRIIILESATLLSKNGTAFFVVPYSFFRKENKTVYNNLNKFGLFIEAILAFPSGLFSPLTSVPLALVLMKKRKPDKVFVAELSPDRNIDVIISNLKKRAEGKIDPLGMLVPLSEFTSYKQQISLRELSRQVKRHKLEEYKVTKLVSAVSLAKKNIENGFEDLSNSIYLPLIGISDVVARLVDLKIKPHNYIQLVIEPKIAMAEYLATFLNSDLGHLIRESLTSGFIPKLTKKSVMSASFYLPNMSIQQQIVNLQTEVNSVYSRISFIQKQFKKNPLKISNIEKNIKAFSKLDSFENWVDDLPFPLASILIAYHAEEDSYLKRSHLFHFFEALSQFNSTVMLSAYHSDKKYYESKKENWIDKDERYFDSFKLASFGSWLILAERLGKHTREMLSMGSNGKEICFNLFKTERIYFIESISNKNLYKTLRKVLDLRNRMKGHGGVESSESIKRDLIQLERHLSEIRDIISSYEGIRLVLPGPGAYSDGIYTNKVQDLMGSRAIFKKQNYDTTSPMDIKNLYLLDISYKAPLELIPFIRFMKSPRQEKNACYFYSRLDNRGVRWISYHFTDEVEIYKSDPQLESILEILRPKNDT